jgi:hypothetical protein
MRIDARTRAEATLRAWADAIGAPFLGVLRDTQGYVKCIERGLTIFDLPEGKATLDREQWAPILDWLDPVWAGHELGSPSQAGALDEVGQNLDPHEPPRVRVTPKPSAARPVLADLASALVPAVPQRPGFFQRLFGTA